MNYKPNFEELDKLVESGHLSKKISNCGKYKLFNYTDFCTFDKLWNEHTLNCRGTVYEIQTGKVVARAFPKFFNLSELQPEKQKQILNQTKFEVFTKEDGSMITLAFYDGEWKTHTRGSFNSDQALKAKEMLNKYDISSLRKHLTYILEIIYPENKIVVNYGNKEELIVLACFETETAIEVSLNTLTGRVPFPIAQSHSFKSIQEVIDHTQTLDANNEGFVIRLASGERVKLKSPEYLKIARIISRMSPLVIWESMVDGKVSTELMMSIPEEFRDVYEQFQKELEAKYLETDLLARNRADEVLTAINGYTPSVRDIKRDIGLYLKDNEHSMNQFVFPLITVSMVNFDKMIMKSIRPTGNIL